MENKVETKPSEIDFLIAYSNAENDEEKEKLKKEYVEQEKAYYSNPDRVVHILD